LGAATVELGARTATAAGEAWAEAMQHPQLLQAMTAVHAHPQVAAALEDPTIAEIVVAAQCAPLVAATCAIILAALALAFCRRTLLLIAHILKQMYQLLGAAMVGLVVGYCTVPDVMEEASASASSTLSDAITSAKAALGPTCESAARALGAALAAAIAAAGPAFDVAKATLAHMLVRAEEALGPQASAYMATAAIATVLACVCLPRRSSHPVTVSSGQKNPKTAARKVQRQKQKNRARMCKFCGVEVLNKSFIDAHVAGKKHRKLAGDRTPDQCWVWVEREEEKGDDAQEHADVEPVSANAAAVEEDAAWVTVNAAQKKKEARLAAAARKAALEQEKEAVAAAAIVAQPRQLRVHRRCNECGVRAREGVTIETDPDDESKAYCTECWDRYYNPQAPEPAPEPMRFVSKWNRDG